MIKIDENYSDYREDDDPDFPFGKAVSASGSNKIDGTPWRKELFNDLIGARQAIFKQAFGSSKQPSNVPDNVTNSDILKALQKIIDDKVMEGVENVDKLIPDTASEQNKLADRNFVNSTVGTNTANYIYKTTTGNEKIPFNSIAELESYSGTVTQNDYAFITGMDGNGNVYFDRYKASDNNGVITWAKEYRLNNSSFTAEQWDTINSGVTDSSIAFLQSQINELKKTLVTPHLYRHNISVKIKEGSNITATISFPTYTAESSSYARSNVSGDDVKDFLNRFCKKDVDEMPCTGSFYDSSVGDGNMLETNYISGFKIDSEYKELIFYGWTPLCGLNNWVKELKWAIQNFPLEDEFGWNDWYNTRTIGIYRISNAQIYDTVTMIY